MFYIIKVIFFIFIIVYLIDLIRRFVYLIVAHFVFRLFSLKINDDKNVFPEITFKATDFV